MHTTLTDTYLTTLQVMRGMPWSGETLDTVVAMVEEIRQLKKEKNAVILSHYYMQPELQILSERGGVADFAGDSLGLSQAATRVDADHIVFCGVRFMAETAKILNPDKSVLLPSMLAGCSLASSITGADVIALKAQYPDAPVVAYINTYAETKAECDVCCTSRNALSIAKALPQKRLIFVPDKFMGRNLESRILQETGKEMILWNGSCEVHEKFTQESMNSISTRYPNAEILVHWEVPDDTVASSLRYGHGVVGSTNDIINYVGTSKAKQFILGSECDLGATLRGMYKNKEFVTPCVHCSYMKQISLENTLAALRAAGTDAAKEYAIELPADILRRARVPIDRMLALS